MNSATAAEARVLVIVTPATTAKITPGTMMNTPVIPSAKSIANPNKRKLAATMA